MFAEMKSFAERNPLVIGAVGVSLTATAIFLGLQYRHLPFVSSQRSYSGYFAEAGGLTGGEAVQVNGYKAGSVSGITLDGARVLVTFKVDEGIHLGDRTEAAIKTKSLLGAKILEVTPRGDGSLVGPIPVERTTSPYQLPDALGDLASTVD